LAVSAATLYVWRRAYDGMDIDVAREMEKLPEQNTRFTRLLGTV